MQAHRAGEPAGRKLRGIEQEAADSTDQQGFEKIAVGGAGREGGWAVCVCSEVDEGLLQAELCEQEAYAEAGELLPFPGAGGGGGLSAVQAV